MTTTADPSAPRPAVSAAPPRGRRFFTRWDALVALLLGLALTAAGWLEVTGYLSRRGKPPSVFPLMAPPTGERLGEDEFFHTGLTYLHTSNIGGLEPAGDRYLRHGLGPVMKLEIWSYAKIALLKFCYYNGVPGQDITFAYNGQTLETLHGCPQCSLTRTYPLAIRPGGNEFTISVARYNHHGIELAPDSRTIAGTFVALDLTPY